MTERTPENTDTTGYMPKSGDIVLIALDGDMGPQGMGDYADVVKVDMNSTIERHLVEDLLRAQLEENLNLHLIPTWTEEDEGYHSRECSGSRYSDGMWRTRAAGNALVNAGVFEHKWQVRSRWHLTEWCSDTPEYLCWLDGDQYEQYHGKRHHSETKREEVSA
jgi:hypothetical protein